MSIPATEANHSFHKDTKRLRHNARMCMVTMMAIKRIRIRV